ncbi:MAG: iron-sulfur cluster-binding domain-containing protein [Deltaproteobacteria bacterium]|nr:iron-sulfur cluster-binding domain-containing protein [Deltaproteobacteria bacterium]
MKPAGEYLPLLVDGVHVLGTFGRQLWNALRPRSFEYRLEDQLAAVAQHHPDRIRVRVIRHEPAGVSAALLTLAPEAGPLPMFESGQYVNVFVTVDGVRTSRPFSLASPATRRDAVTILVRRQAGGFVSPHLVDHVAEGETLELSGPAGDFFYDPLRDRPDLLLVAGGSGVAPFLGILEELAASSSPVRAVLLFGSRTEADILLRERLARLEAERPDHLQVEHVLSEPGPGWAGDRGFIDGACVLRHVPAERLAGMSAFVCGPAPLLALARAELPRMGVPAHRVRTEAYGPPANVTAEPGWPRGLSADTRFAVRLAPGDRTVSARAGEPLMNALERAGVVVPALCRSGVCATCRTRLLEGRVFHPPGAALRATDLEAGFIHPCMAYPVSDLVLRLPRPDASRTE